MRYLTQVVRATTLLSGLALFSYATAAAQAATHTQSVATSHIRSTTRPSTSQRTSAPKVTSFRGIAAKLNTTPEALESAFKAAVAVNPKLTRGQFIAANVLAENLGKKDPKITTPAILDGLKSGMSIGKTLQSLGLTAKDADKAQDAANSEIRRAEHEAAHEPKDSTR